VPNAGAFAEEEEEGGEEGDEAPKTP